MSHWKCPIKKVVLRNCAKITEKNLCQSLFYKLYQNRDFHTNVFLWILRNFWEYRTFTEDLRVAAFVLSTEQQTVLYNKYNSHYSSMSKLSIFLRNKHQLHRSSRSKKFFKIGILKNCAIFTRKYLWILYCEIFKNIYFLRKTSVGCFWL